MAKSTPFNFTKFLMAGSGLAMLMTSGAASVAQAQTQTKSAASSTDNDVVVVVGVRKSEQSAINRKKKAATQQDSIVADDIAQFPDKSVAEAVNRIAGTALDRNEDGGTGGVSIRGLTADLVRVEVNGMSTLSNTNSFGSNTGGRDTNLTDLSSDLVKSIDVVKGATADMTPGGVGGTIRIEQRTGLDFKKPYLLFNVQYQVEDITGIVTPRVNIVASRKFLNGKLGLLANITTERSIYAGDIARNTNASNGGGWNYSGADADASAEKTFVVPATWDATASAVTAQSQCSTLATTGVTTFPGNATTSAINPRLDCTNQYLDFIPDLTRLSRWVRDDSRVSAQLRADYKFTDRLTAFVDININKRQLRNQDYNYSITTPAWSSSTTSSGLTTFVPATFDYAALTPLGTNNAVFSDNHYLLSATLNPTITTIRNSSNVLIQSSQNYIGATTQDRDFYQWFSTAYLSTGFDFKNTKWDIKARAGRSYGESSIEQNVISLTTLYNGSIGFQMDQASGLYGWTLPSAWNRSDPATYMPLAGCQSILTSSSATTSTANLTCSGAGRSPYSGNVRLDYTPGLAKNVQDQVQIDFTRKFKNAGPLDSIKFGYRYDNLNAITYSGAGYTDNKTSVTVPRALIQDNFRVCKTAYASTTNPCVFGTTASSGTTARQNVYTLTEAQYAELISSSLETLPGNAFLGTYDNNSGVLSTWQDVNVRAAFDKMRGWFGLYNHNNSCLIECIGSDGKIYKQPAPEVTETNNSGYLMFNFDTNILGVDVTGNAGARYMKRDIEGKQFLFLNTSVLTTLTGGPPYSFSNTPAGMVERSVTKTTEHVLPSWNVAVWPIADQLALRYGSAKVWAPPPLNNIVAAGVTCNELGDAFDNFVDANGNDYDSFCSGRIGNSELHGYTSQNENISVEWYPNKDTQLSYATYHYKVKHGYPQNIQLNDVELFGKKYDVPSYTDGVPQTVYGWEVSGRTAFTYLPWILKYTGGGFNYSKSTTRQSEAVEPLSGLSLPLIGQSAYSANVNLWYDDGRFNARIAYQTRDEYMTHFTGSTNYRNAQTVYSQGAIYTTGTGFKPGFPVFRNLTEYLDARLSYKLNKNLEFFVEGKNLNKGSLVRSSSKYFKINDANTIPYIHDVSTSGSRYFFGFRAKFE